MIFTEVDAARFL